MASQIHPSEVDFIKKQFSNFSLNESPSEPQLLQQEEQFYERNFSVAVGSPTMDEQDTMPPTIGSQGGSSHHGSSDYTMNIDLGLTMNQITKQFGLQQTFDTLEGHQKLARPQLLQLLEYAGVLARDQGGCRLLQKYVVQAREMNDVALFDHIFTATTPCFWELMNDGFGNYLVQKLAEECSPEQLVKIIEQVGIEPVQLCTDAHGTRSVQKIVEVVS